MSALPQPSPVYEPPKVGGAPFDARISEVLDADSVAQATADILATQLRRPVVSIYRRDDGGDELVLVGVAPAGKERSPIGSRYKVDRSVIASALREGTPQRSLNYYVEADFVKSLPGETRSALAVPVMSDQRVLGIVYLEYPSPHTPSKEDEAVVDQFAGYLLDVWAAPPDSAAVPGDGAGHDAAASALSSLLSSLAQTEDFAANLGRVPEVAVKLLGCTGAALLRRHPSRHALEIVASTGTLDIAEDTLVPLDSTRLGGIFLKGKPTQVSAGGEDEEQPLFPDSVLRGGPGNGLVVPVLSTGKVTGLLVAAGPPASGFGSESVQLLQSLADHAGAAEALRTIGPLRQKISDASLIAEVGRAMTGTLGLDEVLALVVRSAEMLVSGRSAGVALLSADQTKLTLLAASGSLLTHTKAELFTRETVVGWVAVNGENVITDSLSHDERGWPLGENFGPAALVPLESRGQTLGVLFAARAPGAEPIGDDNLDAVRKLGAYAAIAIENARLYQEQTELSATLKKQAQELEKAYSELRTSQERLLVSEKMAALGRVTAGIAHEINSPLGSILNCLQLATTYTEEYQSSATDPEVTADDHLGIAKDLLEALKLAEEATRRVAQFVRTIKGQTRMEEEQVEQFEPADATESTILMLQHELEGGQVKVEADLEKGALLCGDSNKFAVIVQNLVSNAIHAYEGGAGAVQVRLRRDGTDAVLEVEDHGSGIPEEIRPRIYDYLFTTKDVGHGTGLGLSLVHSIVTSHFSGKIEYRTETGAGTTFVVTIPLAAGNGDG